MQLSYSYVRERLGQMGLWPTSKTAITAWYLLGFAVTLALLRTVGTALKLHFAESLGGWISFVGIVVVVLFLFLGFRWMKARILWRLRNRLIVTYVFIGVIPVVLLVVLALGTLYLFAGQFATFIVTSELNAELRSMEASNAALAAHLAAQLEGQSLKPEVAERVLRGARKKWPNRTTSVWLNRKLVTFTSLPDMDDEEPILPERVKGSMRAITRDRGQLYLRTCEYLETGAGPLTVITSERFDQRLLQELAADLGEISLYGTGLNLTEVQAPQPKQSELGVQEQPSKAKLPPGITVRKKDNSAVVLDTGKGGLTPTLTAGSIPPPTQRLDRIVTFATTVAAVDWETGDMNQPAGISVQTRVSKLYDRLFSALGDFAPAVEFLLLVAAGIFAVIELIALIIGARLTRTMTGAVAQLYDATAYINRGDFRHRIPVKSSDQIATLSNSFNSMTASLEKLIEEQKEKQRMENELAIAQEVQEQLFPREAAQLASLELFGFCRPARTVSGDYYDFLRLDDDHLVIAVGDISGKGISAALLMATIHSAVRAYTLERAPVEEAATVGAGPAIARASNGGRAEISPAALLAMLNRQLYDSTPPEKYATLFLGVYEEGSKKLTYSNGGHLPPIVMSEDGSLRRLDVGGTVIGLLENCSYDDASIQLHPGDIFVAFSDGVTEPENDFGEFGEERLIELIRENRTMPLERISEIVTAAVDDWIGANEQPDDVTLVLAREK
ncbi:MAG TPA: SpoIIE family protein phosphatase [Terriglobales bacterium]